MFWTAVVFHENDGSHENDENMLADFEQPNKGRSAGLTEITETTEKTKTTEIWGAKPRFPKT